MIRSQVIDSKGYRENVGIIVSKSDGKLLWCRRFGQDAWQFPQGGIEPNETPEQALYRELKEETGLSPEQVELLGRTNDWISYRIPDSFNRKRRNSTSICIGQKQIWFLLKLVDAEADFRSIDLERPEFDQWSWVDYWYPVEKVIEFKRDVYKQALTEFKPLWQQSFSIVAHDN